MQFPWSSLQCLVVFVWKILIAISETNPAWSNNNIIWLKVGSPDWSEFPEEVEKFLRRYVVAVITESMDENDEI